MKLFIKFYLVIRFILFFLWEIILANIRVAYNVITPGYNARPGVIAIPMDCKTNLEITLFAIIVSLTPGTLALDVSKDRKKLFIHAMFMQDKNKLINHIKSDFEAPLLRILA